MTGVNMKCILTIVLLSLLITGCGIETVDASTDETFQSSMASVKSSLTDEKEKAFDEAVELLAFSEIGNLFAASANPEGLKGKIQGKLDGKTADQIIAQAEVVLAERERKERAQAKSEIEEIETEISNLQKKRSASETAEEALTKFKVLRSRFYYQESSYRDTAIIELTVKNETTHPVSRAFFNAVLSSPGRSIPWVKESFNYQIAGGLEPGEEATWKLSPNMYGAWSKAPKDRDDMVLTVSTYRIDGADDEPIYDVEFSERNQDRLNDLTDRLARLQKVIKS
jgi:hypothetical protein